MVKFYTLHNSAGLIRSNKFLDKEDAIIVGSFRAEQLQFPVKIFAHDEEKNQECVLVCNPDGSVEKPQGMGREIHDMGNGSGVENMTGANLLLAAFDEMPVTHFRLKAHQAISESQVAELEKKAGCDIGMISDQSFNAFTQEPKVIHQIETQLADWNLEMDGLVETSLKRNKAHAALEVEEVTAGARKAQKEARASRLPEFRHRGSSKFGGTHRFVAHCETVASDGKGAPKIAVHVNGSKVGEAKDERGASRIISEHAEKEFSKYLRKEFG